MPALTFDDGPDPRGTPAVVAALAAARVRATFFVLGERVLAHRELLDRVLAAGHAVELHGHAHLRHTAHPRAAIEADLEAGLRALAAAGVAPTRWRVPWGQLAPFTPELAADHGLELVGWTLDTHDWRGDAAPAMLADVAPGLTRGSVVLMHDGVGPRARRADAHATAELVPRLVARARDAELEPGALGRPWPAAVPPGNPEPPVVTAGGNG